MGKVRYSKVNFDGRVMKVVQRSEVGVASTKQKDHPPASDFVVDRLDVSKTMHAIGMVAEQVGPCERVLEPYGGAGWHAHYVKKYCNPKNHHVYDISQDCVDSTILTWGNEVKAKVKDARKLNFKDGYFDWIHSDFQSWTLMRQASGKDDHIADTVPNFFRMSKRFVSITDSGIFGVLRFPKNRVAYQREFGMDVDNWQDYFRIIDEYFQKTFGIKAVYAVWWAGQAGSILFDKQASMDQKLVVEHAEIKTVIGVPTSKFISEEKCQRLLAKALS